MVQPPLLVINCFDSSSGKGPLTTAEVVRLAGADVLVHSANSGKGAALRDLFAYATQCGVDILVILDGDGQHNPDDIPKLIRPLMLDEADIVNGSRYLSGDSNETPHYRRFGQVVLDKFTRLGFSRDVNVVKKAFCVLESVDVRFPLLLRVAALSHAAAP